MKKIYYAKSRLKNGRQPTVAEHLRDVSELAKCYGGVLGLETEAELCGMLHDFGKYSDRFQGVLHGTHEKIDHALCGAALLYKKNQAMYLPVVEAINGHHSGLTSATRLKPYLIASWNEQELVQCNDGKEAALGGEAEYAAAFQAFRADFPEFRFPKCRKQSGEKPVAEMLDTRMLFSCLVDADYSISAEEEDAGYLKRAELDCFDPSLWLERLIDYRNSLSARSDSNQTLNRIRNELFDRCGQMGAHPGGLFTLTAPTGTGKTLALLHFALRHCVAQKKRRIILVLPFLTLAEQNANTYREIIPELLEDHSQNNLPDAAREYVARWSAPVILTTSVKFFESLFAQRPTDCRKLHNIAQSVIVFDEAQSLNPEVTAATREAVNALCAHYGCTVVFSTATQPGFDALPGLEWRPREILPDFENLFTLLRRTRVEWRLSEPMPLSTIAQEMAGQESVCTIVNLRKHARKLYRQLKACCAEKSVFFLSTDLSPAHRSAQIVNIRQRQKAGLPCRVISTQCIEAGVDLDFETLYRALAPLDSIIQAAGRCNRNGKNPAGGRVVVFIPDEEGILYPGTWYENAALLVLRLNGEQPLDIHSPADIARYYRELFSRARDKKLLRQAINEKDYDGAAREYRLISQQGRMVIVPYQGLLPQFEALRDAAQKSGMTHQLMRAAAPLTVSSYLKPDELERWAEPLYFPAKHNQPPQASGYYVLRPQYRELYTDDMGLQFEEGGELFFT